MSRSLTRKDFLIVGTASAGVAFLAACGEDAPADGGGAAGSGTGGGGTGGSGTAGTATGTAGTPAAGGTAAGNGSGGKAGGGGMAGSTNGGAGGQSLGGSGGAGGAGGAGGGGCAAAVVAKISCPHDHALTISVADITAGTEKIYDIKGASNHSHMMTVTAADFTKLKAGMTVFKYTESQQQPHCVTLSCGVAGDPTAAAECGGADDEAFAGCM